MALAFAACNRGASDLEQTEFDLMAILVDGFDFDRHVIAEAHFAVRRFAAQTMLFLAVLPVVAADRGDGHHALNENRVQLDEDTKSLLDDTMTRMLPGRTAIFLPHRISTIRSCDKLFLLHKGRIVATGIHKELLSQNQLYRHLHYLEFNEVAESV